MLRPLPAGALPAKNELEILRGMPPRMIQAWSGGVFPNAEGATDHNKSEYLEVGFQYHTFNLLSAALLNSDVRSLDAALRVAEYAMSHQLSDGSFEFDTPNASANARPSSATLFFYDFGHSLLLLSKTPWFTTSEACAPYRARIETLRTKLGPSLTWLMTQQDILASDHAASNRTLAHGLAFYFVGRALKRPDAVAVGRQIIVPALDAVRPDGTFPEAGGFDSSYQATNLLECAWLYFYLDPSDDALGDRVWATLKNGYAREASSVLPTGEISTAGNSRVRATNGEVYMGHVKSANWKQVALALAYYAGMADDSGARNLAEGVLTFYFPPKA